MYTPLPLHIGSDLATDPVYNFLCSLFVENTKYMAYNQAFRQLSPLIEN